MANVRSELRNTTYEFFIAALSMLSIINIFFHLLASDPNIEGVIALMDIILSLIFLGDFFYRLFTAESKTRYFVRQSGWADLLSTLPFPLAKLLRIFSLTRDGRLISSYGTRRVLRAFLKDHGGSTLLTLLFFMILVLEFGGMAILAAEQRTPDANIKSAGDSLWYIYVTITTVGYGDRFPVTTAGRIVGILVLTLGIGLFSTLSGFLAQTFLAPRAEEEAVEAGNGSGDGARDGAVEVELRQLLIEQQQSLALLHNKVEALEQLLTQSNAKAG